MSEHFKGKGVYHVGPGGIEKPGDFGYRIDEYGVQFVQHCPKFGVCLVKIHQGPPDAAKALWQWNGNWECPTIVPSIGCDHAPRCGQHVNVIDGQIIGNK